MHELTAQLAAIRTEELIAQAEAHRLARRAIASSVTERRLGKDGRLWQRVWIALVGVRV